MRPKEGIIPIQSSDGQKVQNVNERVAGRGKRAGRDGDDLFGDVRVGHGGGPDDAHYQRKDAERGEDGQHDAEEVALPGEAAPVDEEAGVEVPCCGDGEEDDEDGGDGDVDGGGGDAA